MKRLIVVVVAVAFVLTGCASSKPAAQAPHSPKASASATVASTPSQTPTPTPTYVPVPYSYPVTCQDADGNSYNFPTYQQAWTATQKLVGCDDEGTPEPRGGDFLSVQEKTALTTAYGAGYDESQLETLFLMCASLGFDSYGQMTSYDAGQIAEIKGALHLCPDQPAAGKLEAKLGVSQQQIQQRADGTRFGPGTYRVGQDIQPGTYVASGQVTDCYWERMDSSGNIIANNFVSSGLRVEVTIAASDYSFDSSNCGEFAKQ